MDDLQQAIIMQIGQGVRDLRDIAAKCEWPFSYVWRALQDLERDAMVCRTADGRHWLAWEEPGRVVDMYDAANYINCRLSDALCDIDHGDLRAARQHIYAAVAMMEQGNDEHDSLLALIEEAETDDQ